MHHALLIALALPLVQNGAVHVVDAAAGPYLEIQDAVDAAVDGDTILVRTGAYESFVVGNEELAIVGDTGANVEVHGAVRARHLGVGKQLVVQNLTARGQSTPNAFERNGLYLHECAGSVRIQDCTFEGWSAGACGISPIDGGHGAWVRGSGDVALTACTLWGGSATQDAAEHRGATGSGLQAADSALALHSCNVRGGPSTVCCHATSGGHGAFAAHCFVLSENSILRGMEGLIAGPCWCSEGGSGGSGLVLWGESQGWLGQNQYFGGSAGHGWGACGGGTDYDGVPGSPILRNGPAWSWDLRDASLRTLDVTSPVRAGSTMTVTLHGWSAGRAWLVVNEETEFCFLPEWSGMLLVKLAPTAHRIDLGVFTPPTATFTLPAPALPPGRQSVAVHMQVIFDTQYAGRLLGNAVTVVVVDPSF